MDEMYECMPYYYRLTEGHGQGAEHMMAAEAAFDRGMDADALIAMEKAVDAGKALQASGGSGPAVSF